MIQKLIIQFIAKIYTKKFQLTQGVGTVLAMIPVARKSSPKPLTTVEDAQESSPTVSALPQDVAARSDDLAQRFAQRRSRRVTQEQTASQNYSTTTTSTSNSNVDSEPTFVSTSSEGSSEDMYPMDAVREVFTSRPERQEAVESTQATYAEVTRAIEESQAISFWDPIMGFFFGSTLAGLATIGFIIGGSLFIFRGRLNRESVSRALSFFRNNRLLTSAIFGGGTTATTLISQNGAVNWAELQRRIEAFIRWVSVQNVSPSSGLRVPSIFKAKKKSTGKEEKPDNDSDDKGNPFL